MGESSNKHLRGSLTDTDWSKHSLIVTKSEDFLMHELRVGKSYHGWVKFVNTQDFLAVTGDYGNWIFCREYHPSKDGYVSNRNWLEKLTYSSTQEPTSYDSEATEKEIEKLLKNGDIEGEELDDEEREYLENCLFNVDDEISYMYHAFRENVGVFEDYDSVPYCEELDIWFKIILDAFNEICNRLDSESDE